MSQENGEMPVKLEWSDEVARLGDIVPNPINPKYSTDETVIRLNDSLDTLGQFESIVVDHDGISAIDGHQRINAWVAHAGEDALVAVRRPNRALTDMEIKKLMLYSGKGTHGTFDFDLMAKNFEIEIAVEFGGFMPVELASSYNLDLGDNKTPDNKEIGLGDLETDNTCPKCGFEY